MKGPFIMKKHKLNAFACNTFGINLTAILALLVIVTSCSKNVTSSNNHYGSKPDIFLKSELFVFQNNEFVSVAVDKMPEPIYGEDQFYRDMYTGLRYPAAARNNNVQGSVLFEVIINEMGQVESINKLTSVSIECDSEAEDAINRGCKNGFKPYDFEGSIVKVKYLIPVHFRLR